MIKFKVFVKVKSKKKLVIYFIMCFYVMIFNVKKVNYLNIFVVKYLKIKYWLFVLFVVKFLKVIKFLKKKVTIENVL